MKIYADIQRLYVGELIDLFELDCTEFGGPLLRFHGYTQVGPIFWRGNEYTPYTLKSEGLETTGEGAPPTPTLYVGNIGQDAEGNELPGYVSGLCLMYQNLYKARIRIYRTLGRYLDAENYPEGNPEADPTQQLTPEQWDINQKVSENDELVTFSLSSVLDAENRKIPNLVVQVSVCQWTTKGGGYRGAYCGYAGAEMFDKDDQPTSDPAKDYCPGLLQSCQLRRGGFPGNAINIMAVPAADRIRG